MVRRFATTLALSALLLAGRATSASEGRTTAFGPGEQASYDISYLGITGASAQITIGSEGSDSVGNKVWPIVAYAVTDSKLAFYPVNDKFVTYWDFENGRSTGHDFLANENKKRRRQRVVIDHDAKKAKVTRQDENERPKERTHDVQTGTGDMAAVTYQLRSLPLEKGKTFQLPVFTGHKSFVMHAHVEDTQKLDTVLGNREVYRIRLKTDFSGNFKSKRDVLAYVTTDALHVPVRIEAEFVLGSMRAELTNYKQGRVAARLETPAPATQTTTADATHP